MERVDSGGPRNDVLSGGTGPLQEKGHFGEGKISHCEAWGKSGASLSYSGGGSSDASSRYHYCSNLLGSGVNVRGYGQCLGSVLGLWLGFRVKFDSVSFN